MLFVQHSIKSDLDVHLQMQMRLGATAEAIKLWASQYAKRKQLTRVPKYLPDIKALTGGEEYVNEKIKAVLSQTLNENMRAKMDTDGVDQWINT